MIRDVVLIAALGSLAWLYCAGVRRYDMRPGRRSWPQKRTVAFLAGLAVSGATLCSAVDRLADASAAAHMVQHLMMMFVAVPLALLGAPLLLLLAAGPPRAARAVARALRSPPVSWLTFPLAAWMLFGAALWGSHFSPLYEAALENPALHAFEHALYVVAAFAFWQCVIQFGPERWPLSHPVRMALLFSAMPQSAFLGLALFAGNRVLYPHYVDVARPWGGTALDDQHAAGAVMWMAGGLLLFAAFLIVIADWHRAEEAHSQKADRRLASHASRPSR